jgi:hypothetical protein
MQQQLPLGTAAVVARSIADILVDIAGYCITVDNLPLAKEAPAWSAAQKGALARGIH